MPLYEYECNDCKQRFELLVRGEEVPTCQFCRSRRLTKLLSVVSPPGQISPGGLAASEAWGGCGRPQCASGGCQGLND